MFLYHFNIKIVKKYFELKPLVQENLLILSKSNNLKMIRNYEYLLKYQSKGKKRIISYQKYLLKKYNIWEEFPS